jgi:hypothetical protein
VGPFRKPPPPRGGGVGSGFWGRCGDRDLTRFGLFTGARRPDLGLLGLWRRLAFFAVVLPAWSALLLSVLLVLLRRLVHRIQDAEIVFGVLEIAFRHHSVAATGGITAELEVFLEQLLRRSANAEVGAVAVEYMVAVHRYTTVAATPAMVPQSATTAPAAT